MTDRFGGTTPARALRVKIIGIADYWASHTGGDPSVTLSENWNGGARTPDYTASRRTFSDLVLTRPFSARRDREAQKILGRQLGSRTVTVSIQDCDSNDTPIGKPLTYTGCLLVSVGFPQSDAANSAGATCSVTVRPQDYA